MKNFLLSFFMIYFLFCVIKAPSILSPFQKELIEFERKDKSLFLKGIMDVEGVYKDSFSHFFKRNKYVLWIDVYNLSPETLKLNAFLEFKGEKIFPLRKERLINKLEFTRSTEVKTFIGGFIGGTFITAIFLFPSSWIFNPEAIFYPEEANERDFLIPLIGVSMVSGGILANLALEKIKKESEKNIAILKKYYKEFVEPGNSRILFVFNKLPFEKIVVEYKGKEIEGKFEILKW